MSRISPAALTKEQLVDRWGALRAQGEEARGRDRAFEGRIRAPRLERRRRRDLGRRASESTFASLDVKAIRAEMGPEWCAKREKPQTRVFYNFAPVEER